MCVYVCMYITRAHIRGLSCGCCGRSIAEIAGLNPVGGMGVCPL